MFGRRRVRLPELTDVKLPELPEVRLRDVRVPVPEVRLPEVQLPEVRLRDVHLPEVRLPDVQLPDVRLPQVHLPSVPEVRLPSVELAGRRTPELDLGGRAPFVHRRRSNPLWVALKFALGLSIGLAVGCLVAALLAPSAGDDTRRMLRQRVPGGGGPAPLPDEARTSSGAITRGTPVSSAANSGPVGDLRARFEAAKAAMAQDRQAHENELWVRFRRALQTGRASEV
jgi:hypothetical protein